MKEAMCFKISAVINLNGAVISENKIPCEPYKNTIKQFAYALANSGILNDISKSSKISN